MKVELSNEFLLDIDSEFLNQIHITDLFECQDSVIYNVTWDHYFYLHWVAFVGIVGILFYWRETYDLEEESYKVAIVFAVLSVIVGIIDLLYVIPNGTVAINA